MKHVVGARQNNATAAGLMTSIILTSCWHHAVPQD